MATTVVSARRSSIIKGKLNKYWTPIIILLIAVIAIGGIVVWSGYSPSQPIEISIPPVQEVQVEIYIGGAITSPGFYPLKAGDNIETLIQVAGGTISGADLSRLRLSIPETGEEQPQKINLNRAELWLLKALPGVGETRARAIISYREQYGPFHNTNQLTKVEGIGPATYEQIKHLITVAD